jgi:hypothetical protein
MDDELGAWVEATTGGRVVRAMRPPSGGSRELHLLDVEQEDGRIIPLVLRCEAGGSFTGTEISPAKEAVVYRALEHTGVPVLTSLRSRPTRRRCSWSGFRARRTCPRSTRMHATW